ncbi:hypothetical protein [Demequina litorisediminis]|uniref:hypothetical protein n=1 Tax=Demequina litorisediminis TaxID=1849022 RepID=UPI0024E04928|nr:hypothetical protein [Demequina litorisediminis]
MRARTSEAMAQPFPLPVGLPSARLPHGLSVALGPGHHGVFGRGGVVSAGLGLGSVVFSGVDEPDELDEPEEDEPLEPARRARR